MMKTKVPRNTLKKMDLATPTDFEEIINDKFEKDTNHGLEEFLNEDVKENTVINSEEPKPNFTKSVEAKEEKQSPKVNIDFMSDEYNESFIKQQTKRSVDVDSNNGIDNKTSEDILKEEASSPSMTVHEMKDVAEVLIGVIDLGFSTGLRIWSKDTSDSAYSLNDNKKRLLVNQLSVILVKYQAKFKVEVMFLITLLIVYSVPFSNARRRRKAIKLLKEKNININDKNISVEMGESDILKRKQGNPKKGIA